MKKNLKRLLAITLSIMTMMVFSAPAFAYTALDDDGDRAKADGTSMHLVYSSMGMLRILDEGTSVTLSEDGTTVDVVANVKASKSMGGVTKLALIEQTATDAEKDAAAADVVFDNADYSAESVGRVIRFSIPASDLGKKIPYSRYVSTSATEGSWSNFSEQPYLVVEKYAAAPLNLNIVNNVSMFKPEAATLEFKDGGYVLHLTMGSDSYDGVFVGKAWDATSEETIPIRIEDSKGYVDISVTLNEDFVLAFHGSKYFNRQVNINLATETITFDPYEANVEVIDQLTEEEAIEKAAELTSVELVNQMIEAIQVQVRNENTDKYCAVAKALYDALSDKNKAKLDDPGYFGDDTGDASADDPLNTAPDKKKELLVVSFGTSFNDSRVATIGGVEKALADAYGADYAVRRAFTAQIIINHIQARDGEKIDNVEQAMDKAVEAGVTDMIVQPTHLMSGAEYDELKGQIDQYKDKIKITYAKPLLNSDADKEAVAKAVVAKAVEDAGYESLDAAVADKTAFVFMGHGTAHEANATYTYMQQTMDKLGYDNCFVGTVEGLPEPTALPEIKKAVEAKEYTKVVLRPLMVVAGDHANNDMAADEEGSWYYAFVNGGEFEVEGKDEPVDIGEGFGADNVACQINGLGEIPAVQALYVAHTKAAIDSLKPAPVVKKSQTLKVAKAQQTKTAKAKTLKKKAVYTTKVKVTGAKTTISYAKVSGSKKLTVVKTGKNKGKIKVKKGTKKGVYKIKIKITAKATAKYKKATKTVTVKVRVK